MGQDEIIAGRYARALAEVARERDCVDEVRRDLLILGEVLEPGGGGHVPELTNFLDSPAVPPAGKREAARRILEGMGVGETTAHFVGVLVRRGRADLFPRMARMFESLVGELTGEYTAVVRTARPLTEDQREKMAAALGAAFGGTVRLRQRVEPGLLAGARVTVGDRTIDGTVLGRLDGLRRKLTSGGVDAWESAVAEGDGIN